MHASKVGHSLCLVHTPPRQMRTTWKIAFNFGRAYRPGVLEQQNIPPRRVVQREEEREVAVREEVRGRARKPLAPEARVLRAEREEEVVQEEHCGVWVWAGQCGWGVRKRQQTHVPAAVR